MAQLINVKLSRFDSAPWGFRLQGGKDFGQPLIIQKVNGNSIAEKAGLQAGDAVIKVNSTDVFNLSHKEAQNAVVRAGNSFELIVQRGGSTWKPSVTPVGVTPTLQQNSGITPVTKTSLAHKPTASSNIGSAHNVAAKPFVNGDSARNLTSKVYNSPIAMYSEETIAETLSAQTEVLAGGVLGVNFKKNEKTYNAANSEVLKMVQEIDNEPREPEPEPASVPSALTSAPTTPKVPSTPTSNPFGTLRHVQAPETRPEPPPSSSQVLPPGQNICADCERLIVGLFVRIKDKSLHVECFKCATCGTSLKNVGYYNINAKLYCDVHAKLVARQNPPAPDLEPLTIPPGTKAPASVIGSALSSVPLPFSAATPGSPQPGTLAPLPFHAPQSGIRHVNAPRNAPFLNQAPSSVPSIQAPKLNFGALPAAPVVAPAPSFAPKPQPDSVETMQGGSIQYQSYSTVYQSSFSQELQKNVNLGKKMSICSEEVDKLHMDAKCMVKQLSEILEEQDRCPSPTPVSKEEKLSNWETKQEWSCYQTGQVICDKNLARVKETGLEFLRSHSTPVAELEALYNQQQMEINAERDKIRTLDIKKRNSVDAGERREIDSQILMAQNEIIQRQEMQKEIEIKKHVRFNEEIKRRESLLVEPKSDEVPIAKQKELERESYLETLLDHSRTPVAEMEACERHENMSPKTEAIYHTYEHIVSDAEIIEQEHNSRPLTPMRPASPFPGSISHAEKNLLLKNIQGIQYEFNLNKPEQKTFKLPDLRNLSKSKPFAPKIDLIEKKPEEPGVDASLKINQPNTSSEVTDLKMKSSDSLTQNQVLLESASDSENTKVSKQIVESAVELNQQSITEADCKIEETSVKMSSESLQSQTLSSQIEVQRRQVCEELAQNEKFKRKQERFERSKTPVAELEETVCGHDISERTQHVYSSYDEVLLAAERPRSRIGQPQPEQQSITEAEKSLFFQNISGINYEFDHISELNKNIPEKDKSSFIQEIEKNTSTNTSKRLDVGKSYDEFKREQEWLLKLQKENEERVVEKKVNVPLKPPNLVEALTIAPDRPYSPLLTVSAIKVDQQPESVIQLNNCNRRASGSSFPGVNVQRTAYQMHRAQQISTAFEEELRSQETALTQYLDHQSNKNEFKTEASQITYAPRPPIEKRCELLASQVQFGPSLIPKVDPIPSIRPIPKSVSLSEALTIAPERPFSPIADKKVVNSITTPKPLLESFPKRALEIKPIYEVKDLQLKKDGATETASETKVQVSTIEGENIAGALKRQSVQSETILQSESEQNISLSKVIQDEHESSLMYVEQANEQEKSSLIAEETKSSKAQETNVLSEHYRESSKSSSSFQENSSVSQTTEQKGNVVRTVTRRVHETAESAHKLIQITKIDPISGLRRIDDPPNLFKESINQQQNLTGLQKPHTIPAYQNQINESQRSNGTVRLVTGGLATSTSRPRSAICKPESEKVPVTYRSRTPQALPHINKNLPTYNQTEVYRSASPRPIPVPKPVCQFVQQPQRATLQPVNKVYRSTSPLPVSHTVRVTEAYHQPGKSVSNSLHPVSLAQTVYRSYSPLPIPKIVSFANIENTSAKSTNIAQTEKVFRSKSPAVIPRVIGWSGKRVSWPPKEPESDKDKTPTQNGVRAKINEQEKQIKKDHRLSISKSYSDLTMGAPKTNLQSQKPRTPAPKSDIVAPRPFGTPTPQRKIATPHFQPIKPVAITQAQAALIPAPKLTFSSGSGSGPAPTTTVVLTTSPESAFKPLDMPIRPLVTRSVAPVNGVGVLHPNTFPTPPSQPDGADNSAATGGAAGAAPRGGTFAGASAPRRGRGILNQPTGLRVALCAQCNQTIRGPFITALGKTWCPEHFICATPQCRRPLADIGFVEEQGLLYCEFCFEKYIAPNCDKCSTKIKGDCLNAIGKHFHPECFTCAYCGKLFGNSAFFLEDGLPYCENDWNELFTTKCFACGFPIEAGDKWVEALNNNYHSQCFNCTVCKKNLEGQSFFAKGGRPFCKIHSR